MVLFIFATEDFFIMKRFRTPEQAAEYVDSLPLSALRGMLIELLTESEDMPKRINITNEQFKAFFKVIGITDTGTAERRGRPRKEKIEEPELLP